MPTLRPIIFLLCLIGGVYACRPEKADDPSVVVTAKPEFRIDAYEQRDSSHGEATFGLWVESMDLYECSHYRIESEVRQTGQQIEIDLLDVQRPASCTGGPAPARQFVALGQLTAGDYPFRLTLGKTIVNEGVFTVKDDQFSIDLPQPQGIVIQNYTAAHLPDTLLWGYVSVPSEAAHTAAQNFTSEIKAITTDSGLVPGFYSYFTVSGTGEIFFHSSVTPGNPAVIFVRKLRAAPTVLKTLLQNYRAGGQHEPLTLRCFSTFGEL